MTSYTSAEAQQVCGRTFVRRMTEDPVLNGLSRVELGKLGCYNFAAASRLARWMKDKRMREIDDLRRYPAKVLAQQRGIGPATLFVAMVVLDAKGYDATEWASSENHPVSRTTTAIRRTRSTRRGA